jgi:hypothetical protein
MTDSSGANVFHRSSRLSPSVHMAAGDGGTYSIMRLNRPTHQRQNTQSVNVMVLTDNRYRFSGVACAGARTSPLTSTRSR